MYPMFMYWALSGGWWSIGGSIFGILLTTLCFHPPLAFLCVYVIRCACIGLPFYMSLPASAATLFCWLALMGYVESSNENRSGRSNWGSRGSSRTNRGAGVGAFNPLHCVVPDGCTGVVKEVLQAENYYQVRIRFRKVICFRIQMLYFLNTLILKSVLLDNGNGAT